MDWKSMSSEEILLAIKSGLEELLGRCAHGDQHRLETIALEAVKTVLDPKFWKSR